MIIGLMGSATWALPLVFGAAALGVALFCARSPWARRINWSIVDFVWILSSAVTLYFLATSMLYEQARNSRQLNIGDYLSHVQRGQDQANENLDIFCLGATRRQAAVSTEEMGKFCELNVRALDRFHQSLVNHATRNAISRIPHAEDAPEFVMTRSPGQDALILDTRWRSVRAEMIWQNDNFVRLQAIQKAINWLDLVHHARVVWIYAFCLLIAARLGKPIFELTAGRKVEGETAPLGLDQLVSARATDRTADDLDHAR